MKLMLVAIVIIGFLFRFWQLGNIPSSALIDEAHFGYLAHSLIQTGMDEHKITWPLLFKGFGDQKLPLYAYSLLPWIKLFGLSVFSIRISSLIAGTLLIIGSYLFIKEALNSKWTGLFAAAITAFSPWPFFLSRFGFEANLSLASYVFGLTALLHFLRKPTLTVGVLAGILLGLPWYGYIAFRPTSMVVIAAALAYGFITKSLSKKAVLYLVIPFSLVVLPWFLPGVSQSNSARFTQVGIIHDPGLPMEINEQRTFCSTKAPKFICYSAFNKPILIGSILAERWFNTFSPNYLTTSGEPNEKFLNIDRFAQFAPFLYLFFVAGIVVLIANEKLRGGVRFLGIIGLLSGMIPAILAGEPQKVRLTPWYPFVLLAISAGIYLVFKLLKSIWPRVTVATLLSLLLIANFTTFLAQFYFVHFQKHDYWYQSYVPTLSEHVKSLPADALIVIKPFYSDPLMFHAFYSVMDPRYYQNQARLGVLEASGFQHTEQVGNLMAKNMEPQAIACEAVRLGYSKAYLITNDQQQSFKVDFEAKSSNGVYTYARSYEIPLTDCKR